MGWLYMCKCKLTGILAGSATATKAVESYSIFLALRNPTVVDEEASGGRQRYFRK